MGLICALPDRIAGVLDRTVEREGNTVVIDNDAYGRSRSLDDPDLGKRYYSYTPFGSRREVCSSRPEWRNR
jgi:hypothetical protein